MDHKLLTKARALATELRCLLEEIENDYPCLEHHTIVVGEVEEVFDNFPLKGCTQITYQYHEGEGDAD
jgi:hypothetical protein